MIPFLVNMIEFKKKNIVKEPIHVLYIFDQNKVKSWKTIII